MNKGFTLIELLVVVLIIGILAAVALPQYEKAVAKARYTQLVTAGKSLKDALEVYYMANGDYPSFWADLDINYPGCPESSSGKYLLYCDKFAVDLFAGATPSIVFFETSTVPNSNGMSTAELGVSAPSQYAVWLDHSDSPGKTACSSKVSGLCKTMGF